MLKTPRPKPSLEATLVIRDAHPEDGLFIREIARSAFLAFGDYERYLEDWFGNDAVSTSLAELGVRPAGFSMITSYADPDRPSIHIADLVAIAVASDRQSKGIGGRLLAHALARARSSSSRPREAWLVVAEDNQRAQRLFRGAGFRLGNGLGIYPAGQRALRMIKTL